MTLLLIFLLLATPTLAQEDDLISLLGNQTNNDLEASDWGDIEAPLEPTNEDFLKKTEEHLKNAFTEFNLIVRYADTDEVETDTGTAFRIWSRDRDANGYKDKYNVMTNAARRLQSAMYGADNHLTMIRRELSRELSKSTVSVQALDDYCELTRLNTLLIVLEHWCSFRNIRYDEGYWRVFNSSEPPFPIRDSHETPLNCGRSFWVFPHSEERSYSKECQSFFASPLPRKLTLYIHRQLAEAEESLQALCTMEKSLLPSPPTLAKTPKKLQFDNWQEEEFSRRIKAEYCDFIFAQAHALALLNKAVARMSICATYWKERRIPRAWQAEGTQQQGCFKLLPRFQDLCDWAENATLNYGDERIFYFSPTSFGSLKKPFPYDEAEFSQLNVVTFVD